VTGDPGAGREKGDITAEDLFHICRILEVARVLLADD
jgi:hypothetical protein